MYGDVGFGHAIVCNVVYSEVGKTVASDADDPFQSLVENKFSAFNYN